MCLCPVDGALHFITRHIGVAIGEYVARRCARATICTNDELAGGARVDVLFFHGLFRTAVVKAFLANCQEGSSDANSCALLLSTESERAGRHAAIRFGLVRVLNSNRNCRAHVIQA